jgi:hypothetical protein
MLSTISELSTVLGVKFCPFEAFMHFGLRADAENFSHILFSYLLPIQIFLHKCKLSTLMLLEFKF